MAFFHDHSKFRGRPGRIRPSMPTFGERSGIGVIRWIAGKDGELKGMKVGHVS